jgi:hypothetical protein
LAIGRFEELPSMPKLPQIAEIEEPRKHSTLAIFGRFGDSGNFPD